MGLWDIFQNVFRIYVKNDFEITTLTLAEAPPRPQWLSAKGQEVGVKMRNETGPYCMVH